MVQRSVRTGRDRPAKSAFWSMLAGIILSSCALASWDEFGSGDGSVDARDAGRRDTGASDQAVLDAGTSDARADGEGKAPITVVQTQSVSLDNEPATTVNVPFLQPQRAGSLVVVAVGWYDDDRDVASVTDTSGNKYVRAVGPTVLPGDAPIAQSIYYAAGVVAAAANANVVTVKWATQADSPDVRVVEYAGLDPVAPFDVGVGSLGTSSAASSGPVTTRFPNELLFAAATTQGDFTTGGPSYNVRILSVMTNLAQDRIVQEVGSYSADAPLNPAAEWVMQLATFH